MAVKGRQKFCYGGNFGDHGSGAMTAGLRDFGSNSDNNSYRNSL